MKRGRGKVAEKRWEAIFVCMNSRAVHLEVARSLETDNFILVLMRFFQSKGTCEWASLRQWIDRADRELKKLLNKLTKRKWEESCSSEAVSGCSTLKAHRTCPESGKDLWNTWSGAWRLSLVKTSSTKRYSKQYLLKLNELLTPDYWQEIHQARMTMNPAHPVIS